MDGLAHEDGCEDEASNRACDGTIEHTTERSTHQDCRAAGCLSPSRQGVDAAEPLTPIAVEEQTRRSRQGRRRSTLTPGRHSEGGAHRTARRKSIGGVQQKISKGPFFRVAAAWARWRRKSLSPDERRQEHQQGEQQAAVERRRKSTGVAEQKERRRSSTGGRPKHGKGAARSFAAAFASAFARRLRWTRDDQVGEERQEAVAVDQSRVAQCEEQAQDSDQEMAAHEPVETNDDLTQGEALQQQSSDSFGPEAADSEHQEAVGVDQRRVVQCEEQAQNSDQKMAAHEELVETSDDLTQGEALEQPSSDSSCPENVDLEQQAADIVDHSRAVESEVGAQNADLEMAAHEEFAELSDELPNEQTFELHSFDNFRPEADSEQQAADIVDQSRAVESEVGAQNTDFEMAAHEEFAELSDELTNEQTLELHSSDNFRPETDDSEHLEADVVNRILAMESELEAQKADSDEVAHEEPIESCGELAKVEQFEQQCSDSFRLEAVDAVVPLAPIEQMALGSFDSQSPGESEAEAQNTDGNKTTDEELLERSHGLTKGESLEQHIPDNVSPETVDSEQQEAECEEQHFVAESEAETQNANCNKVTHEDFVDASGDLTKREALEQQSSDNFHPEVAVSELRFIPIETDGFSQQLSEGQAEAQKVECNRATHEEFVEGSGDLAKGEPLEQQTFDSIRPQDADSESQDADAVDQSRAVESEDQVQMADCSKLADEGRLEPSDGLTEESALDEQISDSFRPEVVDSEHRQADAVDQSSANESEVEALQVDSNKVAHEERPEPSDDLAKGQELEQQSSDNFRHEAGDSEQEADVVDQSRAEQSGDESQNVVCNEFAQEERLECTDASAKEEVLEQRIPDDFRPGALDSDGDLDVQQDDVCDGGPEGEADDPSVTAEGEHAGNRAQDAADGASVGSGVCTGNEDAPPTGTEGSTQVDADDEAESQTGEARPEEWRDYEDGMACDVAEQDQESTDGCQHSTMEQPEQPLEARQQEVASERPEGGHGKQCQRETAFSAADQHADSEVAAENSQGGPRASVAVTVRAIFTRLVAAGADPNEAAAIALRQAKEAEEREERETKEKAKSLQSKFGEFLCGAASAAAAVLQRGIGAAAQTSALAQPGLSQLREKAEHVAPQAVEKDGFEVAFQADTEADTHSASRTEDEHEPHGESGQRQAYRQPDVEWFNQTDLQLEADEAVCEENQNEAESKVGNEWDVQIPAHQAELKADVEDDFQASVRPEELQAEIAEVDDDVHASVHEAERIEDDAQALVHPIDSKADVGVDGQEQVPPVVATDEEIGEALLFELGIKPSAKSSGQSQVHCVSDSSVHVGQREGLEVERKDFDEAASGSPVNARAEVNPEPCDAGRIGVELQAGVGGAVQALALPAAEDRQHEQTVDVTPSEELRQAQHAVRSGDTQDISGHSSATDADADASRLAEVDAVTETPMPSEEVHESRSTMSTKRPCLRSKQPPTGTEQAVNGKCEEQTPEENQTAIVAVEVASSAHNTSKEHSPEENQTAIVAVEVASGTQRDSQERQRHQIQVLQRARGPPDRLVEVQFSSGNAAPVLSAAGRPIRHRMRPLDHWRNEQVVYERLPGSALPTIKAVMKAQPILPPIQDAADPPPLQATPRSKAKAKAKAKQAQRRNVKVSLCAATPKSKYAVKAAAKSKLRLHRKTRPQAQTHVDDSAPFLDDQDLHGAEGESVPMASLGRNDQSESTRSKDVEEDRTSARCIGLSFGGAGHAPVKETSDACAPALADSADGVQPQEAKPFGGSQASKKDRDPCLAGPHQASQGDIRYQQAQKPRSRGRPGNQPQSRSREKPARSGESAPRVCVQAIRTRSRQRIAPNEVGGITDSAAARGHDTFLAGDGKRDARAEAIVDASETTVPQGVFTDQHCLWENNLSHETANADGPERPDAETHSRLAMGVQPRETKSRERASRVSSRTKSKHASECPTKGGVRAQATRSRKSLQAKDEESDQDSVIASKKITGASQRSRKGGTREADSAEGGEHTVRGTRTKAQPKASPGTNARERGTSKPVGGAKLGDCDAGTRRASQAMVDSDACAGSQQSCPSETVCRERVRPSAVGSAVRGSWCISSSTDVPALPRAKKSRVQDTPGSMLGRSCGSSMTIPKATGNSSKVVRVADPPVPTPNSTLTPEGTSRARPHRKAPEDFVGNRSSGHKPVGQAAARSGEKKTRKKGFDGHARHGKENQASAPSWAATTRANDAIAPPRMSTSSMPAGDSIWGMIGGILADRGRPAPAPSQPQNRIAANLPSSQQKRKFETGASEAGRRHRMASQPPASKRAKLR